MILLRLIDYLLQRVMPLRAPLLLIDDAAYAPAHARHCYDMLP